MSHRSTLMGPRSKGIAWNAIYQFCAQALILLITFFSSPYIVHSLGTDLYGLLSVVGLSTSYFGLVELGLGQAATKAIAEHYVLGARLQLRQVFWTSILTYAVLGSIGSCLLLGASSLLINHALRVPAYLSPTATSAFVWSAAGLFVSLLLGGVSTVPRALQRFDIISKISVCIGIAQCVLSLVLLRLGFSLVELIAGNVCIQMAALGIYSRVVQQIVPDLGSPVWHLPAFTRLLRFGSFVSISQIVGPILVHIEKLIIVRWLSIGALSFYTIPYNLVWSLTIIPSSITGVLLPAVAQLAATAEPERVQNLYVRSIRYVFVLLLPIAVVSSVYAREFLTAWMGPSIAIRSTPVLQILAAAVVINGLAWPSFQVVQAMGRPDIPAKLHVLEVLIHIPLSIILVLRGGLPGAAVAWAVRVCVDTLLLTIGTSRCIGIGLGVVVRGAIVRTALVAAVLSPVAFAGKLWLHGSERPAVFSSMAGIACLYGGMVLWLSMDHQDKAFLGSLVRIG